MSDQIIELKGSLFPISVLYCQDYAPAVLREQLSAKLAQAPGFFTLAPVVISVEQLETAPDFNAIKQVFIDLQLVLVGVCGASPALKKAAHAAGLAALQAPKNAKAAEQQKAVPPASPSAGTPTSQSAAPAAAPVQAAVTPIDNRTIEQNIRSGQQIYVKGGDLIIRGTVGAGAEVIADGNIHIYGALRGKAIAGAGGDQSKKIYCYNMQPELISIAGNYWLSDTLQGDYWGKPVCIGLQDGQLQLTELF